MDSTEKGSTESGSPEGSESPPPPVSSGGARVVLPEPKVMMNMALSVGSMEGSIGVVKAAAAGSGGGGGGIVAGSGGGDLMMVTAGSREKKKRGRPRKYDSEGNLRVPYMATAMRAPPPTGFTLTSPSPTSHSQFSSSSKKGRGRLAGSGNWQILSSFGELLASTAGGDFTPHVVNVYAGEDVAGKILSFAQKGPRGMCVLSANGTVSNVTIRQPGSSGGLLTYEGRFEILSLTGSYTVSENGGMKSRTGGLSVSLAGPDGRVIGGGVAGLLLAASPIQIVVGSFMPNSYKITHRKWHNLEPRTTAAMPGVGDVITEAKPLSQASPAQCIFPTSMASQLPVETKVKADNSASTKENAHSTSTDVADYNGSDPPDDRETPDINVAVEQQ